MTGEQENDRSQEPTQFKLTQARKKGMVARGLDLGFLVSLVVLLLFARFVGGRLVGSLVDATRQAWITAPQASDAEGILSLSSALFAHVAGWLLLLFAAIFLTVLAFEIVQTGFVVSAGPLKPDFGRLNPGQGFKRLFSMKFLIETGKNLVKFTCYIAVAYLIIRALARTDQAAIGDARRLLNFMIHGAGRLLLGFVLLALVFAAIDQMLSRRMFTRSMRMSRREVKREMRDREGDPRLKQKRKQLHASFSKISQSMRNLPGADVLVTNPEHIAIGLRYDSARMPAPQIVSIATNQFAQRLKRTAMAYSIPIVENRELARTLFRRGRLENYVPESCFAEVARVYNDLARKGALRREIR